MTTVRSTLRRAALWALVLALGACAPLDPGPDFVLDPPLDAAREDAGATVTPSDGGAAAPRPPLDPDFFFCHVQPLVLAARRCASERGCHATDSALRLDVRGETDPAPPCDQDRPTGPVPGSYYTNLARSRAETRATAARSDLYVRPLGGDHPVVVYPETSAESEIVRAWIEGAP